MKRALALLAVALAAVAVVGGIALRRSTTLQDAAMRRMVAHRVRRPHAELLAPDALRVLFCGTGSPLPDPDRGQACAAVFAGGRAFLVDAGSGAWDRLQRTHVPAAAIGDVLFTHFHSDHITGLPDVVLNTWAAGRHAPLGMWGGPGVEEVAAGFQRAMMADARARMAHHGVEVLPGSGAALVPHIVQAPADGTTVPVFTDGELRVTAFRVHHPPVEPAYGYRVDYRGRSVVFSGDTTPTPALVAAARGADVLVDEALAPHMVAAIADGLEAVGDTQRARILRDVPSYHTSVVDAAKEANEAGVALLALTHVVPPVASGLAERIFMRGVHDVRPDGVVLAHDGLLLELPAGSRDIKQRDLD